MMHPALQLDFRRPAASRGRGVGWLALAAAVLGVIAVSQRYSDAAQAHDAALSRHEHLEARVQDRVLGSGSVRTAAAPDAKTLADIRRANAVIDQLTVPWDALFSAVEGADARGLGLLSLTPNARDRTLRLAGDARSMEELLAYVERMAMQQGLRQVHLLDYSPAVRDGVPVTSFTLAATWQQP